MSLDEVLGKLAHIKKQLLKCFNLSKMRLTQFCKICQVLTTFRAPVTFTPDSDSITIDFTSKGGPAVTGTQAVSSFPGLVMSFVDCAIYGKQKYGFQCTPGSMM